MTQLSDKDHKAQMEDPSPFFAIKQAQTRVYFQYAERKQSQQS